MMTFEEMCAENRRKKYDFCAEYNRIPKSQRLPIPIEAVKELREKTGMGVLLCKAALNASGMDMEKAIETLREFVFIYG